LYLSADSDPVSNLGAGIDVFANLDDLSDEFVADAERCDLVELALHSNSSDYEQAETGSSAEPTLVSVLS
jgi:hypothetical protein